jgi:hypothetical protein
MRAWLCGCHVQARAITCDLEIALSVAAGCAVRLDEAGREDGATCGLGPSAAPITTLATTAVTVLTAAAPRRNSRLVPHAPDTG